MKMVTAQEIAGIGLQALLREAARYLENDLRRWEHFKKSPRHATHFSHGVFELMPCADETYYTYKYVNAHPANPEHGKLSIAALGMLADIETGYPQLVSDMTLLTAIRTAATSALAAKFFARGDSGVLGLIGTGAQSEFQTLAMLGAFPLKEIRYYDRDAAAMEKYARNMGSSGLRLVPCRNGDEVVRGADIVTTCICEKKRVVLFDYASVRDNDHLFINAIGGDCPGKTELDPETVRNSRIVVEFYEQTKVEGEIQNLEGEVAHDELWEIVQGRKPGRTKRDTIILFDSVGFALADYSMLRMMYEAGIGRDIEMLPQLGNPKDLYSFCA